MAKHRKKEADQPADVREPVQPKVLTPYETGRDSSLEKFLEADAAAVAERDAEQARVSAELKKTPLFRWFKSFGRGERLEKKKVELGRAYKWAAQKTEIVRGELQRGARKVFKEQPEKVQAILGNAAKFKKTSDTELSFIADNLIPLMSESLFPVAVPDIALANVPHSKLQGILDYTLYRLVSERTEKEVGKVAPALLQAGAKASGIVLAGAIHKKASPALVTQLLDNGADYASAFKILKSNSGLYGYGAERLASIQNTFALEKENAELKARVAELEANKSDVISVITKPRAPGVAAGRHRRPLRGKQL